MNQLQHFRGNEEFAKRIYDLIDQMKRYQRVIITPFFTPEEANITRLICGKQTLYQIDGGYEQAERVRFALIPYEDEEVVFPTICLRAHYAKAFASLSHRDLLGAIMHLGIQRDTIGDLIVKDDVVYVFCDEKIEPYIRTNLTKVKRCTLHFQQYDEQVHHEQEKVIETKIVASLRLDVLVSCLAHVSRGKASEMIRAGLVKVDHVVLEQTSYLCNNNSAISIRGTGRFQFLEVSKKTKKDHLVIEVARYT